MKLSHIGDLVHHLLFLVLQHHHELALVEARDEKAKKRAPEKEKKNWRVAIVRLANVRFSGVANSLTVLECPQSVKVKRYGWGEP